MEICLEFSLTEVFELLAVEQQLHMRGRYVLPSLWCLLALVSMFTANLRWFIKDSVRNNCNCNYSWRGESRMRSWNKVTRLYFPKMSEWSQNLWSCQKKETGENMSLQTAHISACQFQVYCPADVFDVEKKKSIEQQYLVLINNIIIKTPELRWCQPCSLVVIFAFTGGRHPLLKGRSCRPRSC